MRKLRIIEHISLDGVIQHLGRGKRFFAEGIPAGAFELVSTNAFPSGVILSAYEVAGPLRAA